MQVGMGGLAYLQHAMSGRGIGREVSVGEAERVWDDIHSSHGPEVVVDSGDHSGLWPQMYLWVIERKGARGVAYIGVYRDPDGSQRSAGAHGTRRSALRAAQREEDKVGAGRWHDTARGAVRKRA